MYIAASRFANALTRYLKTGIMLTKSDVVQLMQEAKIKGINEKQCDVGHSLYLGGLAGLLLLIMRLKH